MPLPVTVRHAVKENGEATNGPVASQALPLGCTIRRWNVGGGISGRSGLAGGVQAPPRLHDLDFRIFTGCGD